MNSLLATRVPSEGLWKRVRRVIKNGDLSVDRCIILFAYLYLTAPLAIFAFGWLKPAYAILYTGILLVSLYSIHHRTGIQAESECIDYNKTSPFAFTAVCLVGFAWVYFSGIGNFSFQNADFEIRNAYLRDLTSFRWPVVFSYDLTPNNGFLAGHRGALAYYLTFWLPAALVGKLAGWHGANIFLFLWSLTGIYLLFYLMFRYLKSYSIWIVIIFIFWSGLDIVGVLRKGSFKMGQHIEWWAGLFQYSSFTTALYWTFNQAIPIWLIVALMINHKRPKNIVYLYALALPYSPFSFIGLTPYVIYYMIKSIDKKDSMPTDDGIRKRATLFERLPQIVTFQNILFPISTLLIFAAYFTSKKTSYVSSPLYLRIYTAAVLEHHSFQALKYAGVYVFFCLLEFGIYAIILNCYKREPLYVITISVLLALPFFDYFDHNLIMRASFPALLILMLYTAKFLIRSRSSYSRLFLVGVLLVGSLTPLTEIYRSVAAYVKYPRAELLADHFVTFSIYSNDKKRLLYQHIAVDPETSFFFSKLGK